MPRIAIIGSGIAGLSAAHRLHRGGLRDLAVFEAGDYVGGHTATVDVEVGGRSYAVDTGFIVYNELTYPRFSALLAELGVASRATDMSFGVRDDRSGVEYSAASLSSLFAQRRTLASLGHWRMLADIVRFNRVARELLATDDDTTTLDDYLARRRFSAEFRERFVVPMGAAVWSAPPGELGRFPARYFVEFFANHRFLDLVDRPVWRTVVGGSREYVGPLTRPFADRIRLRTPVQAVRRRGGGVEVVTAGGVERFDRVVIACHGDHALRLLADPTDAERQVLGAIAYHPNDVVLHTDTSLLPRTRRAWGAWNYHVHADPARASTVTYDMNHLQGLDAPVRFCVTLNETAAIDPAKILRRFTYDHPAYTTATRAAQKRWDDVCPPGGRTLYAGAYWSYGFHEDGVRSGYRAADAVLAAERAAGAEVSAVA
jgi:predicted NAD/FAD-binding protein